jgi:DNA-binding transcriptional regulator YiaG
MEKSNLIKFPLNESIQCPVCEHVQTSIENDTFTYDAVELTVSIPVRTCNDCGFRFTDEVEHETICQHLGVMTPKKIGAIRKQLSWTEFSEITSLDEVSLARWENGELIQNPVIDKFLYLLKFPENLERLKIKNADNLVIDYRARQRA